MSMVKIVSNLRRVLNLVQNEEKKVQRNNVVIEGKTLKVSFWCGGKRAE